MTDTAPSSARGRGRPPVADEDKKHKNRYSINVADTTLAALGLLRHEFPAWNSRLVASQIPGNKVEQGE